MPASGTGKEPRKVKNAQPKNKTIKKKPVNAIKITSKTYYIDTPNSKGFKIGDQRVIVSSDNYPMSGLDEVNYLLGELVNYSEFAGNYKNNYQKDDANEKMNNNSFFQNDKKDWYIIPVKYKEKEVKDKDKEAPEEKEGDEEHAVVEEKKAPGAGGIRVARGRKALGKKETKSKKGK